MKLLDTNILLRLLLDDDPAQVRAVERFIRSSLRIKDELYVSDLSVAEMIWVLEGQDIPPTSIAQAIREILQKEGIHFEHRQRLMTAISLYESYRVDFIDAYQAALVQEKHFQAIVSFDRDYARLPVTHIDPSNPIKP